MKTDTKKIEIDELKKNIVVIGDSYDLTDIIEVFLYQKYNIIATTSEFDGIKKYKNFKPVCIFIKVSSSIKPVLAFVSKLLIEESQKVPIIVFTKEEITTISEFKLKSVGIKEIIKFPIKYQEFLTIMQNILKE
jgi:PleD family two-component response regulator